MAIVGINTYQDFIFTGGMQSFSIPFSGLYKLEVWGAKGGNFQGHCEGGNGGYSVGYKKMNKGQTIYIACGGQGTTAWGEGTFSGGYNGGGTGKSQNKNMFGAGGGGATHIASTNRGTLNAYAAYTGDVLIVAGGGGSAGCNWSMGASGFFNGGHGGGSTGEIGGNNSTQYWGTGGSQTAGGYRYGSFGQGGGYIAGTDVATGGGGGWYGGGGGTLYCGGGGGSGYTGGVPTLTLSNITYTSSTSNGVCAGNGLARITFIKKISSLVFNGIQVEDILYNGKKIELVIYNGITVFG